MANNSQVAHRWANGHRQGELTGSHFYYEGDRLYSYVTVIGRIVLDNQGNEIALLSEYHYTHTTARHLSLAYKALGYGRFMPTFSIPQRLIAGYSGQQSIRAAVTFFIDQARESVKKAERSRIYAGLHCGEAQKALESAIDLCGRFGLPQALVPVFESIIPNELIRKAQAQDERNRQANERAAIQRRELSREQREREHKNFLRWLDGATLLCPGAYATDEHGSAYIRVVDRQGVRTVQTSMGAEVPLSEASKAFQFVKLCRMVGKAWQANGSQVPVGDFALRSIDEHGNTRVGCHYFTWERIAQFAQAAGIFELPGSDLALEGKRQQRSEAE